MLFGKRLGAALRSQHAFPPPERLQLIFSEMVHGTFHEDTRRYVQNLLLKMKARGCDAAGLCCTELPLLLKGAESPLPLLDSTMILAQSALKVLAGENSLPIGPGNVMQTVGNRA